MAGLDAFERELGGILQEVTEATEERPAHGESSESSV